MLLSGCAGGSKTDSDTLSYNKETVMQAGSFFAEQWASGELENTISSAQLGNKAKKSIISMIDNLNSVKEEVGANITDIYYLGVVQSHLSAYNEDCNQHYFTAHVYGTIGKSAWIDEEELHGCSIVWCDNLQQAIKLVQSGASKEYVHLFERARELAGLKAAISKNK